MTCFGHLRDQGLESLENLNVTYENISAHHHQLLVRSPSPYRNSAYYTQEQTRPKLLPNAKSPSPAPHTLSDAVLLRESLPV